jgi:DNA-binding MarR family transcriptional regulator
MNKNEIFDELDHLMQLISKTFHSSGASYLCGLDITMQQFMVLKLIAEKENPRMTDLAEELGVTMGNMTAMAERLIKHGYVVRKDDPEDRRIVRICLTAAGKDLMVKASDKKKKTMEMIIGKISQEDRTSLRKIMEKLASAVGREKGGKQ